MTAPIPIANLALAAQGGDRAALELLLSKHLRAAHTIALGTVGRWEDAADVVQAAFLLAIQKIRECQEPERFSGWLLRIVRRCALDALRSRTRRPLSLEDPELAEGSLGEPRAPDVGGSGVARRVLLMALAKLPERRRQVVLLHDLEGWKHSEIAELLQITEVMSRQELFVARRDLRATLSVDQE